MTFKKAGKNWKKAVEETRDEAALHCRTLMRDHEWLVPEQERPELAPPPEEKSKTQQFVDRLYDAEGRGHLPPGETVQRMKNRVASERPNRRLSPSNSPSRTVIR